MIQRFIFLSVFNRDIHSSIYLYFLVFSIDVGLYKDFFSPNNQTFFFFFTQNHSLLLFLFKFFLSCPYVTKKKKKKKPKTIINIERQKESPKA